MYNLDNTSVCLVQWAENNCMCWSSASILLGLNPGSYVSALIHGINTRLSWSGWQGCSVSPRDAAVTDLGLEWLKPEAWQVPNLTAAQGGFSETLQMWFGLIWALMVPTALCEQEKGQASSREVLWALEDVMGRRTFGIAWIEGLREMETTVNFLFEWKQSQKSLSLLFLTNTC